MLRRALKGHSQIFGGIKIIIAQGMEKKKGFLAAKLEN